MYNFQLDLNSVPIFYINKENWTEHYKYVIHQCLNERMCYLLIEPDPDYGIRMIEITCMCRADFTSNYDNIDKILCINKYNHKKTNKPYSLVTDNFMFKENGEWKRNLVLYKTEYENPDGKYFARTREDFNNNFEKV